MIITMNFKAKHSDEIGFYSLFVYLFNVAKKEGVDGKLCISGDYTELRENLNLLKLPNLITEIDLVDSENYLSPIYNLEKNGIIREEPREVLSCDCGQVCVPKGISLWNPKRGMFSEGVSLCCNSKLSVEYKTFLQTAPIEFLVGIDKCIPACVIKEINNTKSDYTGRKLIISRKIKTKVEYKMLSGNVYNIDNDLINYLSPSLFLNNVTHIVGGRNLIKHSVLFSYFNQFRDKKPLTFSLLPKVVYKGEESLADLVYEFGAEVIKRKLLQLTTSTRIEINISKELFKQK